LAITQVQYSICPHDAGLYQHLMVPPESTVTFSAWSLAWSSSGDNARDSEGGRYWTQVGIDPTGGTNPENGEIISSEPVSTCWKQQSIAAISDSSGLSTLQASKRLKDTFKEHSKSCTN
jgi:hypothetical protein